MSQKGAEGFGVAMIIIALALVALSGLIAWRFYDNSKDNQHNSQKDQTDNEKSYSNTKYKYAFNYPNNLMLRGIVGVGTDANAQPDSPEVAINQDNVYFDVGIQENQTLTVDFIKMQFGATDPKLINAKQTAVNGILGYEVEFLGSAKDGVTSRAVYLQPTGSKIIYKIRVKKNSATSNNILNSFTIN